MNYLIVFLALTLGVVNRSCGQGNRQGKPIVEVYVFDVRYSDETQKYLRQNNYLPVHVLPQRMIDADNDLVIEDDAVKKAMTGMYPDQNDTTLCVIDWEGKMMRYLKTNDADDQDFKRAEATYLRLIGMIREMRPNVRIAAYGLPFQEPRPLLAKQQAANKLDNLLRSCDYLTPSFYMAYPEQQVGKERNISYLKNKLDNALAFGQRINKPVIPFVWYKVHPNNKLFGGQILSKDEMAEYLSYIAGYRLDGKGIKGVIWWENAPVPKNRSQEARAFAAKPGAAAPATVDSILINYTRLFFKK